MAETLRSVGFFMELPHGEPDGPSLRAAIRPVADPREAGIVAYLRAGTPFAVSGRMVSDVLSASDSFIAPLETYTDGVWTWPADLAHYVERYHVELPDDFVEHAAEQKWVPPALTDEELIEAMSRMEWDEG